MLAPWEGIRGRCKSRSIPRGPFDCASLPAHFGFCANCWDTTPVCVGDLPEALPPVDMSAPGPELEAELTSIQGRYLEESILLYGGDWLPTGTSDGHISDVWAHKRGGVARNDCQAPACLSPGNVGDALCFAALG